MRITEEKLKHFFLNFRKTKIQTKPEMSRQLGVTHRQVSTYLKRENVLTSYNKNGKYYALSDIMEFDKYGIWEHNKICFSKNGNLIQTFIYIVTKSTAGLSHKEIKKILHLPSLSFLSSFRHLKEIKREKISGIFIYFSNGKFFSEQRRNRLRLEDTSLSDIVGISVLKERIKFPELTLQELSARLKKTGTNVTTDALTNFFSKYGILENSEFTAVRILKDLKGKVQNFIDPKELFEETPEIFFNARGEDWCSEQFKLQKTTTKLVQTLHIGKFNAKYQIMKRGKIHQPSKELLSIVAAGSNYGYDVIERIGNLMHLQHKQAGEIRYELQNNNIKISESEVEILAKKYIVYLSIIHEWKANKIVEIMDSNGGYILHLDALGDAGINRIISGIDSLTDFVLGNSKISTENSDEIIPFLKKIKRRFGTPLRIVQDMGKGIMKAAQKVFKGVKILICHFHFLRDIGKDLLGDNYDIIRKRLRHFAFLTKLRDIAKALQTINDKDSTVIDTFHAILIKDKPVKTISRSMLLIFLYTLIKWILNWKNNSNGYGFPFDRPQLDLAFRVKEAHKLISKVIIKNVDVSPEIIKYYLHTAKILEEIEADKELKEAIKNIKGEIKIFDSLRKAMRIAPKGGTDGLNDEGGNIDISTIENSVMKVRKKLEENSDFVAGKKGKSFLKQLNKYWDQLFADSFTVKTAEGPKVIQPQRTNNISERAFRDFRRANKRKSGSDDIGNTIKAMVDDMPLIKNLRNDQYVNLILGDKRELHEVFAEIDPQLVQKRMDELNISDEKIPEKIQELLDDESLIEKLSKYCNDN